MKFDRETAAAAIALFRSGVSRPKTAEVVGVDRTTLWRWFNRGERDRLAGADTEFARFVREAKAAEAEPVAKAAQAMARVAGSGSEWKATAWYLSRKLPAEYGQAALTESVKMQLCEELVEIVRAGSSHQFFGEFMEILIEWARAQEDRQMLELAAGSHRAAHDEIELTEGDE